MTAIGKVVRFVCLGQSYFRYRAAAIERGFPLPTAWRLLERGCIGSPSSRANKMPLSDFRLCYRGSPSSSAKRVSSAYLASSIVHHAVSLGSVRQSDF